MAMTLRLPDDVDEALTALAHRQGRSKQEIPTTAIRSYVEGAFRRTLLEQVLDGQLPRYEDALRRLGE